MLPVSTELSVTAEKNRGKMLAKEPRLDVLISCQIVGIKQIFAVVCLHRCESV